MSEWQVVDPTTLRRWVGDDVSDLERIRVAEDGELEYCDRIVLIYTGSLPMRQTHEDEKA